MKVCNLTNQVPRERRAKLPVRVHELQSGIALNFHNLQRGQGYGAGGTRKWRRIKGLRTEKLTVVQDRSYCLLALLRDDGKFHAALFDQKEGVASVASCVDHLPFAIAKGLSNVAGTA